MCWPPLPTCTLSAHRPGPKPWSAWRGPTAGAARSSEENNRNETLQRAARFGRPIPPAEPRSASPGRPGSAPAVPIGPHRQAAAFAVAYVAEAAYKVSPVELRQALTDHFALSPRRARRIIRSLLSEAKLAYTYEYGASYLGLSARSPLRITDRIVIQPAEAGAASDQSPAAVRIIGGASFGCGRHPTTRLALRGIDAAVAFSAGHLEAEDTTLLDIGTGSGVLALAALRLGVGRAVGIDPDPCARAEAAQNAALNELAARFCVASRSLSQLSRDEVFTMIAANLRCPSLVRLCAPIVSHLTPNGLVVLSGMRTTEQAAVVAAYQERGFECRWQGTEKGWAGLVLQRGGG
jgi:ribosomal protein L11 methyltransferase